MAEKYENLENQKKMTQEQLAEQVGIGTPNISYFETGKFTPAVETLEKIAKALDVEIYELYMFKPLKSVPEIKKELIEKINSEDELAKLLYKFYLSVK